MLFLYYFRLQKSSGFLYFSLVLNFKFFQTYFHTFSLLSTTLFLLLLFLSSDLTLFLTLHLFFLLFPFPFHHDNSLSFSSLLSLFSTSSFILFCFSCYQIFLLFYIFMVKPRPFSIPSLPLLYHLSPSYSYCHQISSPLLIFIK